MAEFIRFLVDSVCDGFLPLSWNGLGFDFDILAEESGLLEPCRELARNHVDMMFHVVCEKGFPVSLKSAASGLRVKGKLAGVSGIDAPALWAEGEYDLVTSYVCEDVRTTLDVARKSESLGALPGRPKEGRKARCPFHAAG